MAITVYGIPNCDTVKKARTWLETHEFAYVFHDYKKSGVDKAKLVHWCDTLGWETVLNRAGTTFRKLSDDQKSNLDRAKAMALMLAQPSMIKRPLVEHDRGLLIGFRPEAWSKTFGR